MAGKLVRLDCSGSTVLVVCECGFRDVMPTRVEGRRLADAHRRRHHPIQARRTEAKRRQRARS